MYGKVGCVLGVAGVVLASVSLVFVAFNSLAVSEAGERLDDCERDIINIWDLFEKQLDINEDISEILNGIIDMLGLVI